MSKHFCNFVFSLFWSVFEHVQPRQIYYRSIVDQNFYLSTVKLAYSQTVILIQVLWCNLDLQQMNYEIYCLFVCLFNRSLRAETHLGPDGTRLKQNAQTRLKSQYKHAGQLVYENIKKLRNRFEDMRWRKRRPWPLPTNQVEQFYRQRLGQEKGDSLSILLQISSRYCNNIWDNLPKNVECSKLINQFKRNFVSFYNSWSVHKLYI